jgi:hypothetical protein
MIRSMSKLVFAVVALQTALFAAAQNIPQELRGKWIVTRDLPTKTIGCWGERDVKRLIGTRVEYTADSFRWKNTVTDHPEVTVTTIDANQFQNVYSGSGTFNSQVSFDQLGIHANAVKRVKISHPPAEITGGTIEIPGDEVLIKNQNTIIFSVCNVYFEARRASHPSKRDD